MAKEKDQKVDGGTYERVARAERRLLRDEERALKRLEKARARLVRAEEKLSESKDRVERRLAAVSVAENELSAAQQARAEGPVAWEKETAGTVEVSQETEVQMPPPQAEGGIGRHR